MKKSFVARRGLTDVVCNTSPIQYLHQLGQLDLLQALSTAVFVPPAVENEIARGIGLGIDLPDIASLPWITIRAVHSSATYQWRNKLGSGEVEVLQLGLEMPGSVVVLDDRVARKIAAGLNLRLKGTIGLLIDAKQAGLIREIRPLLDQLDALGFRLAASNRAAALRLAGETGH